MRNNLLFILIILSSSLLCAQQIYNYDYTCKIRDYNFIPQMYNEYPFNKTKKIVFVEYNYGILAFEPKDKNDTIAQNKWKIFAEKRSKFYDFMRKRISFDSTLYKNPIQLSENQINELKTIMVNYQENMKGKNFSVSKTGCGFQPDSSILFLDENDYLIEDITLCHSCKEIEVLNQDKRNFELIGYPCDTQFELYDNFFINFSKTSK